MDSCLGNKRGEICDSKNSRCMCSKGIEACKEGEYCLDRVCSGTGTDFVLSWCGLNFQSYDDLIIEN